MGHWNILELEKPVAELDKQIEQIRNMSLEQGVDNSSEIEILEQQRDELLKRVFSNLSTWDRVLLARHPKRPYTLDYVRSIFDEFIELHGDRLYRDDCSMVCGIGSIEGRQVAFVGHQKGRDLKERQYRNFGSSRPDGYRKAMRIMHLAEQFGRPIVCFVDTPAADCTVDSEARGISEAIARNMMEMSMLRCPVVAVVIGEGGSGGAIGVAVADRVLMLENSIYSVIPPEGCASILWRDKAKAPEAADALKISAEDALKMGIIEEVINEPLGGAQRDFNSVSQNVKRAIIRNIDSLSALTCDQLISARTERFRKIGEYKTMGEQK